MREIPLGGHALQVVCTDRSNGDFAIGADGVQRRRQELMTGPWTWLRLTHGTDIVSVVEPGDGAGQSADGGWSTAFNCPIAVSTADCAPVVVGASEADRSAFAVVHAGWRGLRDGIVERAGELVRSALPDAEEFVSFCGPCIGPDHYEFSARDLTFMEQRFGSAVAARTLSGAPGLDLFAGVVSALAAVGFPAPERPPSTASTRYFSHRVRADRERMTTVVRMLRGPQ